MVLNLSFHCKVGGILRYRNLPMFDWRHHVILWRGHVSYLRCGDWEEDVAERLVGSRVGDGNVGPCAHAQVPRPWWDLEALSCTLHSMGRGVRAENAIALRALRSAVGTGSGRATMCVHLPCLFSVQWRRHKLGRLLFLSVPPFCWLDRGCFHISPVSLALVMRRHWRRSWLSRVPVV